MMDMRKVFESSCEHEDSEQCDRAEITKAAFRLKFNFCLGLTEGCKSTSYETHFHHHHHHRRPLSRRHDTASHQVPRTYTSADLVTRSPSPRSVFGI